MSSERATYDEAKEDDLCVHAFWYTTSYFSVDGNYILECIPQVETNKSEKHHYDKHSGFVLGMGISRFWRSLKFGNHSNWSSSTGSGRTRKQSGSDSQNQGMRVSSVDSVDNEQSQKEGIVFREVGQLPPPAVWPNRPLYLRTSPLHYEQLQVLGIGTIAAPGPTGIAADIHGCSSGGGSGCTNAMVREMPVRLHVGTGTSGFGTATTTATATGLDRGNGHGLDRGHGPGLDRGHGPGLDRGHGLGLDVGIPIDTEHFHGRAYLLIADLPDSPKEYFRKMKRSFQCIVQGRFTQPVPFTSLYTGQAFDRPFSNPPPSWILSAIRPLIMALQPAVQMDLQAEKPYILSPFISTQQTVVVSIPGQEPSMPESFGKLQEDISLHGEQFKNMSSSKRKSYFSSRKHLEQHQYDPNFVYTFDFFEHVLRIATFKVDLGFLHYDILKVMGYRPVQHMAVLWDPLQQKQKQQQATVVVDHNSANPNLPTESSSSGSSSSTPSKNASSGSGASSINKGPDRAGEGERKEEEDEGGSLSSTAAAAATAAAACVLSSGGSGRHNNHNTHNASNSMSSNITTNTGTGTGNTNNNTNNNNNHHHTTTSSSVAMSSISNSISNSNINSDSNWEYAFYLEMWHERSLQYAHTNTPTN